MKGQIFLLLASFAVITACARRPVLAQPRFWDGHLNIEGDRDAQRCSDLRARSPTSFHVRGWDRPDYVVEVCKFAAAGSRSDADQLLRSIAVSRSGARF